LVRMIVSDKKRALEALEGAGLLVIEASLLRIEASNRPGALGEVCARLGRAEINIQYLYGSVGISTRACLFLRVSDVARAKKALERCAKRSTPIGGAFPARSPLPVPSC